MWINTWDQVALAAETQELLTLLCLPWRYCTSAQLWEEGLDYVEEGPFAITEYGEFLAVRYIKDSKLCIDLFDWREGGEVSGVNYVIDIDRWDE